MFSEMLLLLLLLRLTTGTTGQGFVARLPTGRNRVGAALSFCVAQLQEFEQLGLTTGTGLHQGGRTGTRLTGTTVAQLLTTVGFTVQCPARRRRRRRRRTREREDEKEKV